MATPPGSGWGAASGAERGDQSVDRGARSKRPGGAGRTGNSQGDAAPGAPPVVMQQGYERNEEDESPANPVLAKTARFLPGPGRGPTNEALGLLREPVRHTPRRPGLCDALRGVACCA